MQLSGQPRSQDSLLPVPGNEVVLSPFTGCVKSVKNLRCEMSYLYYHLKKIIFIMKTVSALGLVLKVRVFWFLEVVKGLWTACRVSGVSGGKRGKEKRKSRVS